MEQDSVEYDRLIELYKLIIGEKPKPPTLTPAESAVWDELKAQVDEIIRLHPDAVLDIPF